MIAIEDSQQYVKVQDEPKLSSVWFLSVCRDCECLGSFVLIFCNGSHTRWLER